MIKPVNILIIEPSDIIRRGVIALIDEGELANIVTTQSPDATGAFVASSLRAMPDVVIINNTLLGSVAPSELRLKSGNDSLKVIALQTTLTESSQLSNYDDTITIYDSAESIKSKILNQITQEDDEQEYRKELSAREKEIIVCVVKGMTNKQIAETLYISTHTVIAHRRNIASKLQIHSPAGLTIFAIVNKLVDLSEIKS